MKLDETVANLGVDKSPYARGPILTESSTGQERRFRHRNRRFCRLIGSVLASRRSDEFWTFRVRRFIITSDFLGSGDVAKPNGFLTVSEEAELLGDSRNTLRCWDRAGILKAQRYPITGYCLYLNGDLAKLLRRVGGSKSNCKGAAQKTTGSTKFVYLLTRRVFRFQTNCVLNSYLRFAFRGEAAQAHLKRHIRETTVPRNLKPNLMLILIPLPPADEQRAVVDTVERQFTMIRKLVVQYRTERKRSVWLRQSIFKDAFEGKLVEQDPNEEPATALLARIRAEREKQAANGKLKRAAKKRRDARGVSRA